MIFNGNSEFVTSLETLKIVDDSYSTGHILTFRPINALLIFVKLSWMSV